MASYAESHASFRSRALQIQLKEEHIRALEDNDVKCFNHLAFAVSGQPGQLDNEKFDELLDIMCPRGPSIGIRSALRQLSYEALTVAVAAIRQRVETPDESKQKLPAQEKDARLKKIQKKITRFEVAGVFEPAHCVIDAYAQMVAEGNIKILPLSRCISREQELHSVKTDKSVVTLENQQLHIKNNTLEATTDVSTELKVHYAFIRRGLALAMAGLASYSVHEKVTRELMVHLTRDPPPNFNGPTLEAVLRADKLLWTKVADKVRSSVREDENGQLPVDLALTELSTQAEALFHLLPTPAGSRAKPETSKPQERSQPSAPKGRPKGKFNKDRTKMPQVCMGSNLLQLRESAFVLITICPMVALSDVRRMAMLINAPEVFTSASSVGVITPTLSAAGSRIDRRRSRRFHRAVAIFQILSSLRFFVAKVGYRSVCGHAAFRFSP